MTVSEATRRFGVGLISRFANRPRPDDLGIGAASELKSLFVSGGR